MAMQSDWDSSEGQYRASCYACGSLGNYTSNRDAANAEMQHQLSKHPVQLQGNTGNASTAKSGKDGKPAKLTRDQKRNNFKKPGKK